MTAYSDGPTFALILDAEPGPTIQLPADGVVLIRDADSHGLGCAHGLTVVGNRITGAADIRGNSVPARAMLADQFDGVPSYLLAEFATRWDQSRTVRKLIMFTRTIVGVPNAGPLRLVSRTGARNPGEIRAAILAERRQQASRPAAPALVRTATVATAASSHAERTAPPPAAAAPQPRTRYVGYRHGVLIQPPPTRYVNYRR
jgi:hypothetical protein